MLFRWKKSGSTNNNINILTHTHTHTRIYNILNMFILQRNNLQKMRKNQILMNMFMAEIFMLYYVDI